MGVALPWNRDGFRRSMSARGKKWNSRCGGETTLKKAITWNARGPPSCHHLSPTQTTWKHSGNTAAALPYDEGPLWEPSNEKSKRHDPTIQFNASRRQRMRRVGIGRITGWSLLSRERCLQSSRINTREREAFSIANHNPVKLTVCG